MVSCQSSLVLVSLIGPAQPTPSQAGLAKPGQTSSAQHPSGSPVPTTTIHRRFSAFLRQGGAIFNAQWPHLSRVNHFNFQHSAAVDDGYHCNCALPSAPLAVQGPPIGWSKRASADSIGLRELCSLVTSPHNDNDFPEDISSQKILIIYRDPKFPIMVVMPNSLLMDKRMRLAALKRDRC